MSKNYWSEFEYNKLKLLLHHNKFSSLQDVFLGKKKFDEMPPISVELHLTNICNLNCFWCTDKQLRMQTASLDMNTLENLFAYFSRNSVGVTIEGGGEPTLHPQFTDIVTLGKRMNLSMGLITNGVKKITDTATLFKWIRVSLDAANSDEYCRSKGVDCYDSVIDNLCELNKVRQNHQTHLGVGYVVTRNNMKALPELIKKLDSLGIDYMYMRPVEESHENAPSLDQLLHLKKLIVELQPNLRLVPMLTIKERLIVDNDQLPCVMFSLTCIIQANGDVALCEKRRHDPVILGNITQKSFAEIWSDSKRADITQRLLNSDNQKGCRECRLTSFNRMIVDLNNIHTKYFI